MEGLKLDNMATNRFLKKLRLSRDAKYLIILGDDLDLCTLQNNASIKAMQMGSVSNGSTMPNSGGFHEFINHAKSHPQMDHGVYQTLISEWSNYKWSPLSPGSELPSMVRHHEVFSGEGYFGTHDIQEEENELSAGMNDCYTNVINKMESGLNVLLIYMVYNDQIQAITGGITDRGAAWRQADFDLCISSKCKKSLQEYHKMLIIWAEIVRLMND